MKLTLKRVLLLALLVAMVTTLTGCTFGRARLGVEFMPDPLVIDWNEGEVAGDVTLTLDGFGTFELYEIRLDFLDAEGQIVESDHLPQGGVLPNAITLVGTMGLVKKTVSLEYVMGSETVKINRDWWLPGVPHPASCKVTFFSSSGKLVGSGSVGLKWDPSDMWLNAKG